MREFLEIFFLSLASITQLTTAMYCNIAWPMSIPKTTTHELHRVRFFLLWFVLKTSVGLYYYDDLANEPVTWLAFYIPNFTFQSIRESGVETMYSRAQVPKRWTILSRFWCSNFFSIFKINVHKNCFMSLSNYGILNTTHFWLVKYTNKVPNAYYNL